RSIPDVFVTGIVSGRLERRDGVLFCGAHRLRQCGRERVVGTTVVDDEVGLGHVEGVHRGGTVTVRIGGGAVDDGGDGDLVAPDRADDIGPYVGAHDDIDSVVARAAVCCGGRTAEDYEQRGKCAQPPARLSRHL